MISQVSARALGIVPFTESLPTELRPHWSEDEVNAVILAAYRQVFGNEHLMSSERLVSAESLLRQGCINVRDFIRTLALSELYRKKFFYSMPQIRFIELNYKHLLGRAPYDQGEIAYHVDLFNQAGYDAEINSYLDSEEYCASFGDSIVPYYRGFATQRGQKTVGFSRIFQLYRGFANSDRSQGRDKGSALTYELAKNTSTPVRTPTSGQSLTGTTATTQGQFYRLRVSQAAKGCTPQLRRGIDEFVVPYDRLSATLQALNQRGCQVLAITCT